MNIPFVFKKCTKCGEWLVANIYNFYKMKNGKWGLESQCKECRNRKQKEKYANNNEWKKERLRKNREYHKKSMIMMKNGGMKKIEKIKSI